MGVIGESNRKTILRKPVNLQDTAARDMAHPVHLYTMPRPSGSRGRSGSGPRLSLTEGVRLSLELLVITRVFFNHGPGEREPVAVDAGDLRQRP